MIVISLLILVKCSLNFPIKFHLFIRIPNIFLAKDLLLRCVYVILTYSVEKTSTLQSRLNFKNRESLKLEKKKLLEVFNLCCNIFRSIFWNSGSATVVMKLLVCFDNSLDFVLW